MQKTLEGFDPEYERRKERARADQAEQSLRGRDIGPLPPVPPRGLRVKDACRENLRAFLEFFLRPVFALRWSADHLAAIETLQDVFLRGGQFAYAMPRGNGKTSLCIGATLWAMMFGHRRFIVPVCATGPKAEQFLESIKTIVETNDRLLRVFPEVCYPIRALERINNRATGQLLAGEHTRIKWTGKRLILPTVEQYPSSGVIVHAAGLLGSVRGLSQASPDGNEDDSDEFWDSTEDLEEAFAAEELAGGGMIRPDAAILDDPQTDESAKMPAQTEKRLQTINKAILNLAGPDKKIAVVCPCTVILPNDLADQLLDRERNPEWRGRRTRLLTTMPNEEAMKLWAEYREIRKESLREHEDIRAATAFYESRRESMSAGAVVAWAERYESEHIDALQYAMDKWAKSEESFWAEYQNEPRPEEQDGIETLRAPELIERCDGTPRGQVPEWATVVTAFADVQQDVLPWMVVAWGPDLRGHIIDYGAWPEQKRKYYTLREVSPTLRELHAEATVEGGIESGLNDLAEWIGFQYSDCKWFGVDANWPLSTEIVYAAARRFPFLMPFHGRFIGAASLPMRDWKKKPGERQGHFWRTTLERNTRAVNVDSNTWKSMILKRCKEPVSSGRGITWFGARPYDHEMLCDQLAAEYAVRVTGRGRKCDEWKNRPGRDNHWWDCLVGAAVGASIVGLELVGQAKPAEVKRYKASQVQAAKRGLR